MAIFPLTPLHLPSFTVGIKDKRKVVDANARVCPKCHNGNSFPIHWGYSARLTLISLSNSERYSCELPHVVFVLLRTRHPIQEEAHLGMLDM